MKPAVITETESSTTEKPDPSKYADLRPRITVVGIGGAGCNAINNMISSGLSGVDFVVANTDAQSLAASSAEFRLQLGVRLTEGLGAGSKPEIGEAAAVEAVEEIKKQVDGSHMVFIAAGMGGGTGTGASSVIARTAKELGILTVGVVTRPFQFEGARRQRIAEAGIAELKKHVDTLIVIPNQNLFRVANERTTFEEAFILADQVLYSGVACIVDLIVKDGLINLDFADVRTVMSGMGTAMMGTGEAAGEHRAIQAAEEAIANPLLDDVTLDGAKGLLLSITGGRTLTLFEVDEAASRVREEVDSEANIIVGATFDESLDDRVRVSIVASGMARHGEVAHPTNATRDPGSSQDLGIGVPFDPNVQATPPPIPRVLREPPGGRPDDVQRRLSQALETPGAAAQQVDVGPASPESAPAVWQAPNDVLIEEAPEESYSAGPHMPPPVPAAPATATGEATFAPRAPAEIRRPLRRMPEVGDFPEVGQREYRNKVLGEAGSDAPAGDPDWYESARPQRKGLLGRLTDRVRGGRESIDADSHDDNAKVSYPQLDVDVNSGAQVRAHGAPRGENVRPQNRSELPGFMGKKRRN